MPESTPEETEEGRHVRPFADWMVEQRKGALSNEMADALNTLVDAVNSHHKGGTLTLRIAVKPAHSGDGMVLVTDEVTVKLPEADRTPGLFFVDGNSNLSRANPAQPELALREVPSPATDKAKEAASQ